jgi:glutamine amidotransferase
MCRLVAYLGVKPILLGELIEKPENSLINQSKSAKNGCHIVNADGFGLSWYDQEVDNKPGIFKSIQPAWNDKNLSHIAQKVASNCFLGHIRASTIGDVTFNNCHPFSYQEYSFAHNGTIRQFEKLRRDLINFIDEELFLSIKAQTDSEHLFFLIMHFLKQGEGLDKPINGL